LRPATNATTPNQLSAGGVAKAAASNTSSPAASAFWIVVMHDLEDQQQWYCDIYLPLVRRALAGERIDPWLLAGGQRQANEDQLWDQRNGDDWA
jgi:hypothetical protein